MTEQQEKIEALAAELGLTMRAEFVPWSKSRNAAEKCPSLNWKITLSKDGRDFLTTDYMAGCGHAPSYDQRRKDADYWELIRWECEKGFKARISPSGGFVTKGLSKPILPNLADVLHSLMMDAEALDCGDFEEWASSSDYDSDSRKAEAIYRACLEIGLKVRNGLGDAGLIKLRQALADY